MKNRIAVNSNFDKESDTHPTLVETRVANSRGSAISRESDLC